MPSCFLPSTAPLSGPMDIAETLGGFRSSSKPMKVQDQSKKDKYLFKRRDDLAEGSAGSLAPAAYLEGSSAVDAGGYILQKRAPSVSVYHQSLSRQKQDHSTVEATLGQDMVDEPMTTDGTPTYGSSFAFESATEHAKTVSMQESRENQVMKLAIPGLGQVQGSGSLVNTPLIGVKRANVGADGVVKKKKVIKQSSGELGYEMTVKKKKKRKELDPEKHSDRQQNRLLTGKTVRLPSSRDSTQPDPQKKDDRSSSISDLEGLLTVTRTGNVQLEMRDLLDGLQCLAVDNFLGAERTSAAIIVRQSLLRFRSLVYQKSLVLAPASEFDSVEYHPAKSSFSGTTKQPPSEADRKFLLPKPVKPSLRPDGQSKGGRKRAHSDHLEELEAKKLKSMSKSKSLTTEKKAVQKGQDMRPGEGKENAAAAAAAPVSKSTKPGPARRMDTHPPSPSAAEPTMLVMKFPPKTSLPSVPELKARFARFGPLDYNSIRVFWKSSTCRVVFQHKLDAQAACKYAIGNSCLFGNINVRYQLRPVDLPGPEGLETASKTHQADNPTSDTLRSKDLSPERQVASPLAYQPKPQQQPVQLKSCLKKPPGEDEGTTAGNGRKGTACVKFLLGGEENPRQDQPVIGNSSHNAVNGSFGDGTASSSTSSIGGTIYNCKNLQHESSLPPLLPLPPQFAIPQQHNNSHQIPLRNQPPTAPKISPLLPTPTITTAGVDVSKQMLGLLTRCNDVVTGLTGLLGYAPYHPL